MENSKQAVKFYIVMYYCWYQCNRNLYTLSYHHSGFMLSAQKIYKSLLADFAIHVVIWYNMDIASPKTVITLI